MQFSEKRNISRWIVIAASFSVVSLILWNTYNFFQIFKNEERIKMELWAKAYKIFNNDNGHTDLELPGEILINNKTIPIILTEDNKIKDHRNIEDDIAKDKIKLQHFW